MITIDITTLVSTDLKSRSAVADLLAYVKSLSERHVLIDFSKVQFATRSFIDEYYNTFVKSNLDLDGITVETINQPDDIKYMLNVVSKTQTGKKLYEEPANTSTKHFGNIKELSDYLRTLCLYGHRKS